MGRADDFFDDSFGIALQGARDDDEASKAQARFNVIPGELSELLVREVAELPPPEC